MIQLGHLLTLWGPKVRQRDSGAQRFYAWCHKIVASLMEMLQIQASRGTPEWALTPGIGAEKHRALEIEEEACLDLFFLCFLNLP